MTKRMLVLPALALLVVAATAPADIKNTAHDFSTMSWSGGEVCKPCHTPHNAVSNDTNPDVNHILWNHEITQATFTLFDGTSTKLNTWSKLCLSCHDGTVALDNFGGKTSGANFIQGKYNVGTDLRDDHPVSVEYTEAWHTPKSALPREIRLFVDPDTNKDNIECSTCHAAHGVTGVPYLLRMDNAGSALCFACHATR